MKINKFYLFGLLSFVLITACQKDSDQNNVPVVNAGTGATITLPDSVVLKGTGSDLDGKVVAYLWSQVSGPAASIIENPGSDSTVARFTLDGKYIFQLMVTDNLGATGVDTVLVTVKPSPIRTVTFQPNNNPNEKALILQGTQDNSTVGLLNELVLDAWTAGGANHYARSVFKFDLSSIPATATILNAHLFLYSNTPPDNGNKVDANVGANNSFTIQQITSDWSPSTTNWTNQPVASTSNQIVVPSTTASSLDLDIDVTSMVGSMVNTSKNYGFIMKLQNEVAYTSRIFVSSYNVAKVDKHPKLVITYK